MTIDPETLMAYADGELDAVSAKRVEKAITAQPELAAQVAAHRALRATLADHFAPVVEAPLPDRLTALLDDRVVPFQPAPRKATVFQVRNLAAMAAALVMGLLLGQVVSLGGSATVGTRQGALVAQGDLAKTLDMQLASTQPADAATRIGLTFRDREGHVCRSFESPALSGIACRAEDIWRLKRTIDGDAREMQAYRQAGSAEIIEAAQNMMAGAPMDAEAERKARQAGW
ncbi:anti-sigma factor [Sphingobium algorifonticola]|uniref:Anti-sigma factor n=1 Tax=Sphingobium algorifonticola TaxID=2008318 RepID=A0A437J9D7_9SPHN|nr:anti-sigma factor [Sphingobium algorifonticola]RVT42003.1 anti-sigma factor [Sphingobium algorifonticola]